jgi:anti-sigma factor RsiW
MKSESHQDDDERALLLVHALVDGELDPVNANAIEQRIASDPLLARERANIDTLQRVLRERLPRELPAPGLEARIRKGLGLDRGRERPRWAALAASVAVAAVVSSAATQFVTQKTGSGDIPEAVLAGHVRALMAPQTTDVLSSDSHTVKPWFAGRIPLAPRVVDLTQDGFRLVGGRIDVVARAGVPTLVYQIREHAISVTAVPQAARDMPPASRTLQGYNIVHWTANNIAYWVVSDLNLGELETFARRFRDAPP